MTLHMPRWIPEAVEEGGTTRKKWLVLGIALGVLMLLAIVSVQAGPAARPPALDSQATASLGTRFTYQGRLVQGGTPVNGTCDFQFSLYDFVVYGTQISTTQSLSGVGVADGLFTVQLDFGSSAFQGDGRWLQIGVRCPAGSGSYTILTPRQPLTPAPYALALPGLRTQQDAISPNLIGGHSDNSIGEGVWGATISGGGAAGIINQVTATYGAIGGGVGNTASGHQATVGGGGSNVASGNVSTVSGGTHNGASEWAAAIGGGTYNTASGQYAAIGGGSDNTAGGKYAAIPGGYNNTASGVGSFAAGRDATASHDGSFVWGDGSGSAFSTDTGQFLALASNGFGFYTSFGNCTFYSGSNWTCSSDRNLKENFTSVDESEILERLNQVPIARWNMKGQDPNIHHLGPVAQDFHAAFGLGEDDEHINTGDALGVAFAAIQGLYQMVQEKESRVTAQQKQIDTLRLQNVDLAARVGALEQSAEAGQVSNPSTTWLILGGLLVVGMMLRQRRRRERIL